MPTPRLSFAPVLILFLLGGCWLPRDPEGTADRVEGGTLDVGLLDDRDLDPPDATALAAIAAEFSARPRLRHGDPHQLLAALERGDLDLLIGGIPASTPFADHAGLSAPFGEVRIGTRTEDRVLAVRKGENRFLLRINRSTAALRKAGE